MSIEEFMRLKGFNLRDLAALFQIRPSTLYAYVKGVRMPRLDLAYVIIKKSDNMITFEGLLQNCEGVSDVCLDCLDSYIVKHPGPKKINSTKVL